MAHTTSDTLTPADYQRTYDVLGIDRSTVAELLNISDFQLWRYETGIKPCPGWLALALIGLHALHAAAQGDGIVVDQGAWGTLMADVAETLS